MFWFMGSEILIQGLLDPLLWLEERKFPGGRSVWWKLLTSRRLESREHQVRSGQIDSAEANDPFPPRNKHFPSSPPFSNVLFKFWTHHRINPLIKSETSWLNCLWKSLHQHTQGQGAGWTLPITCVYLSPIKLMIKINHCNVFPLCSLSHLAKPF